MEVMILQRLFHRSSSSLPHNNRGGDVSFVIHRFHSLPFNTTKLPTRIRRIVTVSTTRFDGRRRGSVLPSNSTPISLPLFFLSSPLASELSSSITTRRTKWYSTTQMTKMNENNNNKNNSNNNAQCRSPYTVLQLRTNATKDEIKASFRKLAKKYHPDLNPSEADAQEKMAQLIHAYDELIMMTSSAMGESSSPPRGVVALACEMYTISELQTHRLYSVYTLRIVYDDENENKDTDCDIPDENCKQQQQQQQQRRRQRKDNVGAAETDELSSTFILPIMAHPDDSVSDLKRHLQELYAKEWGLENRRLDRDGIATGWELVNENDGSILSYHLFLQDDYGIQNNGIVHAVIQKHNEEE